MSAVLSERIVEELLNLDSSAEIDAALTRRALNFTVHS